MAEIWDEALGAWVPEGARWVPDDTAVPSEPVSDPLLDLLDAAERAMGGYFPGRRDDQDEAVLTRAHKAAEMGVGGDRSDDGGHAAIRAACAALRAAVVAYQDAAAPDMAAALAVPLAFRAEDLLNLLEGS